MSLLETSLDWFYESGKSSHSDDSVFYKTDMERKLNANREKMKYRMHRDNQVAICKSRQMTVEANLKARTAENISAPCCRNMGKMDGYTSPHNNSIVSSSSQSQDSETDVTCRSVFRFEDENESLFNNYNFKNAVNVHDCKCVSLSPQSLDREELLTWVNFYLAGSLTRIEELASGAAYCQFMDLLFPKSIYLKKVKFQAKLEHQFIHNFKLLEYAFEMVQVNKLIPMIRLVKGGFTDNFEFAQWFKRFFDANYKQKPYNALDARGGIPLGTNTGVVYISSDSSDGSNKTPIRPFPIRQKPLGTVPGAGAKRNTNNSEVSSQNKSGSGVGSVIAKKTAATGKATTTTTTPVSSYDYQNQRQQNNKNTARSELEDVYTQLIEAKRNVFSIEKERDFYFKKLREIEVHCEDSIGDEPATEEINGLVIESRNPLRKILQILYTTEDGFELPKENEIKKENQNEFDDDDDDEEFCEENYDF